MQRIEKDLARSRAPFSVPYGSVYLVWSPLPLELGDSMAALTAFYKLALTRARVAPVFKAEPHSPSVLVVPSLFRDVVLYTFVSETDQDMTIQLTHLGTPAAPLPVKVFAGRATFAVLDRKTGTLLTRDFRTY